MHKQTYTYLLHALQVPILELPEELQSQVTAQLSPEVREQLQLQSQLAKGHGVGGGGMSMGAPRVVALPGQQIGSGSGIGSGTADQGCSQHGGSSGW